MSLQNSQVKKPLKQETKDTKNIYQYHQVEKKTLKFKTRFYDAS